MPKADLMALLIKTGAIAKQRKSAVIVSVKRDCKNFKLNPTASANIIQMAEQSALENLGQPPGTAMTDEFMMEGGDIEYRAWLAQYRAALKLAEKLGAEPNNYNVLLLSHHKAAKKAYAASPSN